MSTALRLIHVAAETIEGEYRPFVRVRCDASAGAINDPRRGSAAETLNCFPKGRTHSPASSDSCRSRTFFERAASRSLRFDSASASMQDLR